MIIETLFSLFNRDLLTLKKEIELYKDEKNMWKTDKNITNSAGNLCLHLIGNLNAYIGAGLAKTDYTRNREFEFTPKNIPRTELIQKITEVIRVIEVGLLGLNEGQLKQAFPIIIWDQPTETEYTLVHLLSHLNYHIGQINYHRRLLD